MLPCEMSRYRAREITLNLPSAKSRRRSRLCNRLLRHDVAPVDYDSLRAAESTLASFAACTNASREIELAGR